MTQVRLARRMSSAGETSASRERRMTGRNAVEFRHGQGHAARRLNDMDVSEAATNIYLWRNAQHPPRATAPRVGRRTAQRVGGRSYGRTRYPIVLSWAVLRQRRGVELWQLVRRQRRRSRRTRSGRSVTYTPTEWRTVEPFTQKAREQAQAHPERRDLFLCHAWDDREGSAKELYGLLKSNGASVWFSEEDLPLGSLMIREIDKGLRNCRVGIVLVTPALLKSIEAEGVAEKELAVLLSTRRVIPVLHGVSFDDLNDVSPMLASHAGLSTKESSLDNVAAKVAAAAAALAA